MATKQDRYRSVFALNKYGDSGVRLYTIQGKLWGKMGMSGYIV